MNCGLHLPPRVSVKDSSSKYGTIRYLSPQATIAASWFSLVQNLCYTIHCSPHNDPSISIASRSASLVGIEEIARRLFGATGIAIIYLSYLENVLCPLLWSIYLYHHPEEIETIRRDKLTLWQRWLHPIRSQETRRAPPDIEPDEYLFLKFKSEFRAWSNALFRCGSSVLCLSATSSVLEFISMLPESYRNFTVQEFPQIQSQLSKSHEWRLEAHYVPYSTTNTSRTPYSGNELRILGCGAILFLTHFVSSYFSVELSHEEEDNPLENDKKSVHAHDSTEDHKQDENQT